MLIVTNSDGWKMIISHEQRQK